MDPTATGCARSRSVKQRDYVPFPPELPAVERLREQAAGADSAAAAGMLEGARALDPTDPQVLIQLACAYARSRRVDDALRTIHAAEALHPYWHSGWHCFGLILMSRGFECQGIAFHEHWAAKVPNDAEAHGALGHAYTQIDAWHRAIEAYRHAVRLEPDNFEWHEGLGISLKQLGRYEEAHAAYAEVVRLEPDYADGRSRYGSSLLRMEQYEAAAVEAREVLRLVPCDTWAKDALASALEKLGDPEEAMRLHEQARTEDLERSRADVAERPDSAFPHLWLAWSLLRVDRTEEAIAALRESIRLDPTEPDAYATLARVLEQQGRHAEARHVRLDALLLKDSWVESTPQWTESQYVSFGRTDEELGHAEAALEAYGKAIALQPSHLYAWLGQGRALLMLDRCGEAGVAFQRVLDLRAPELGEGLPITDVYAYIGLGRVAEAQGNRDLADQHWRAAWAIAQQHDMRSAFYCADVVAQLEAVMPEPPPVVNGA